MSDGVLIGIIVGAIFGSGICFISVYYMTSYLRKLRLRSIHDRWVSYYAPSVRGNLVRTFKYPIEKDYYLDMEQEIGKGGCGIVVYGEKLRTTEPYAIKIVKKDSIERSRLDRELKLLKDVDHTNIVRLFCVYDRPDKIYFVMELCTGGHLGNLISHQTSKHLDEEWAKVLCKQILSAVTHLHSRGIAHRDIKLQNILLDLDGDRRSQVKLIDLGYGSRYIGALPMRTKCGTPYTTAPEVLREHYDERCDVWSVGVVLYIMLSGKRPFEALNIKGKLAEAGKATMITNILAGRYHFKYEAFNNVSKEAKQFVQVLLNPDYRSRVHSNEALENPWLKEKEIRSETNLQRMSRTNISTRTISRMLLNQEANDFQHAGMLALAFGLQPHIASEMRQLFQTCDSDSSGSLSITEFCKALTILAPGLNITDYERLFNMIDIDNDGSISYTEFLAASIDPRTMNLEELNEAFDLIDSDSNGYITKDELKNMLAIKRPKGNLGIGGVSGKVNEDDEYTKEQNELEARVNDIMKKYDINNDGGISLEEFLWAMTGADAIFGDMHVSKRPNSKSNIYGSNAGNDYDDESSKFVVLSGPHIDNNEVYLHPPLNSATSAHIKKVSKQATSGSFDEDFSLVSSLPQKSQARDSIQKSRPLLMPVNNEIQGGIIYPETGVITIRKSPCSTPRGSNLVFGKDDDQIMLGNTIKQLSLDSDHLFKLPDLHQPVELSVHSSSSISTYVDEMKKSKSVGASRFTATLSPVVNNSSSSGSGNNSYSNNNMNDDNNNNKSIIDSNKMNRSRSVDSMNASSGGNQYNDNIDCDVSGHNQYAEYRTVSEDSHFINPSLLFQKSDRENKSINITGQNSNENNNSGFGNIKFVVSDVSNSTSKHTGSHRNSGSLSKSISKLFNKSFKGQGDLNIDAADEEYSNLSIDLNKSIKIKTTTLSIKPFM